MNESIQPVGIEGAAPALYQYSHALKVTGGVDATRSGGAGRSR